MYPSTIFSSILKYVENIQVALCNIENMQGSASANSCRIAYCATKNIKGSASDNLCRMSTFLGTTKTALPGFLGSAQGASRERTLPEEGAHAPSSGSIRSLDAP
jgi:hypothetical protein